jgi:hypothetical protein
MKNIFVVLLSVFIHTQVFALVGAVSNATGGSGRGAVDTTDGILLNPAFLVDFPAKYFTINYSQDDYAVTVVDNGKDSFFPAALQFVETKSSSVDTRKFGISLATPRWKILTFGTTVSLVEYSNVLNNSLPETKYLQGVADLGLTLALTKDIGFGLVANKIGSTDTEMPPALELQKSVGAGFSYTYANFIRLRFDVQSAPDNKTDDLIYMYGLENFINEWLVLRIGYQNNKVTDRNYLTGGLGFDGPQFGFHYAYVGNTADQPDQKHFFDLSIPF